MSNELADVSEKRILRDITDVNTLREKLTEIGAFHLFSFTRTDDNKGHGAMYGEDIPFVESVSCTVKDCSGYPLCSYRKSND
jgi:hypothetical protein